MSTIPQVPDWLVNLAMSVLQSVPGISRQVAAQLQDRLIPLDFAVFGYAGTGKTTLLNRMQSGIPTSPDPTAQIHQLDEFEIHLVGRGSQKIRRIFDVPGRPLEAGALSAKDYRWPDWETVFLGQMPRGVIFLIDHLNPEESRAALRYVVSMIERADEPIPSRWLRVFSGRPRERARKNLKVFMLLVNKLDIWERQGVSADDILRSYAKEIERVIALMRRNGGRFYRDEISALRGTNYERVVQNFMLGLLSAGRN